MAVRAIRGATTVDGNTGEEVAWATRELMEKIIAENGLETDSMISILFTTTPDITAMFPAAAVRAMGICDVPLLDMAAPDICGALKLCVRVLVHAETERKKSEIKHIYLKGARKLRPDIAGRGICVAIDGPAGAGKSSAARAAAKELGYVYIDTGAMYRAAAVYAIENGIEISAENGELLSRPDEINLDIKYCGGVQRIYLNGRDVSERIRESDATMGSSAIAVIPEVRERLTAMQKELAKGGGVIMDGRDIATSVLPGAELKIYLTASVEERAARRYKENLEKGIDCDYETLKADVEARDYNDTHRAASPLRRAKDAVLLDTTDMTFDESVAEILRLARKTIKERGGE